MTVNPVTLRLQLCVCSGLTYRSLILGPGEGLNICALVLLSDAYFTTKKM